MANDRSAWRSSACAVRPTLTSRPFGRAKRILTSIETAGPMMAAGPFQHDPASCHSAIPLLQLGHVLLNRSVDLRCSAHALEIDLNGRFHDPPPSAIRRKASVRHEAADRTCREKVSGHGVTCPITPRRWQPSVQPAGSKACMRSPKGLKFGASVRLPMRPTFSSGTQWSRKTPFK
jgi:hypothetical protein